MILLLHSIYWGVYLVLTLWVCGCAKAILLSKESCLSSESDPSGYKYEFIDKIPEDLFCQRCKHVAREPNLTSCCTESFCKDCISPYLHDDQPCPSCGEKDFIILLNKKIQKKILSLELYCSMKSHVSGWDDWNSWRVTWMSSQVTVCTWT